MITKEKTMSKDVVWCNLVRNHNKSEPKQPDWVAPPNLDAPEGKKWTKIDRQQSTGYPSLRKLDVVVLRAQNDHIQLTG